MTKKNTAGGKQKANAGAATSKFPFFSDRTAAKSFKEFANTVSALRHPQKGCPWDLQQDHITLRKYMIEEAYEAAEVMMKKSSPELCGELGDVLLQVVLNSQVAAEQGAFTLADVVNGINEKMRRRHPHVFRPQGGKGVSIEQVWKHWKEAKRKEKGGRKTTSLFAEAKKARFPATTQARKIGEIAASINFDWDLPKEVLAQLESEVKEVGGALKRMKPKSKAPSSQLIEEIGDVYFTLAQLCRHTGIDPEVAAISGNQKFLQRFALVEDLAIQEGISIKEVPKSIKEKYWQMAKSAQKNAPRP